TTLLHELRRPPGQALDSLGDWRMRRKQVSEIYAKQGLDDKQMRCRGRGCHRDSPGICVELLQSARQGIWIAGEMGAGGVGLILAGARYGKLDEARGDGSHDQHKQSRQPSSATAVAVTAAHAAKDHGKAAHAGEHSNGAGDGCRYRTNEDVTVVHVAEFVGQYAFEFLIVQ